MKTFKILIVEDDSNLGFLIRERLGNQGYEVENAESAAEGYQAYLAFRPDLVLTDIFMGEESGIDLVKRIRLDNPNVATIYMTCDPGRLRPELEEENVVYHSQVLFKPFSGRHLLDLISVHAHGGKHIAA